VGLWSMGLVSLKGMGPVEWKSCVPVDHWPGRPEGCSPAEIMNVCGSPAWQALWVLAWQSRDHACLWIPGLAGLRGAGLVEIMNACGSLAWQALGAWPGRVEIMQSCAGLSGVVWQRSCGSEGWEFGGLQPWLG
jgi:hypothetical protein